VKRWKIQLRWWHNRLDIAAGAEFHTGSFTFIDKQIDNVSCRVVAKQLSEFFFVIWNFVFFNQRDKVSWRISSQS
jgi:hypothetical protein